MQFPRKETITVAAPGEARFVRQTAGRGHYAHVKLKLRPLARGSGRRFTNSVVGGTIPSEFIQPTLKGIEEALSRGVLGGNSIDDLEVELLDGSYHETDSSDLAFKIAGAMASQDALSRARPVVLEAIVRIEVVVPAEHLDAVLAELSCRRAKQVATETHGTQRLIRAHLAAVTLAGFASQLHVLTDNRVDYSEQLDGYEPVDDPNDDGPAAVMVVRPRR